MQDEPNNPTLLERIQESLRDFTFLYPKDLVQLASILRLKRLAKGEHLVREGEYNYSGVRVLKGLLAHYIVDENGAEKILLFVPEKGVSGALQTTMNKKPADENIIALEDSLILTCDMRSLEHLAADNIRILKLLNQSYKDLIVDAAMRIKFLIAHNDEERYNNFTRTYPGLEQRVRQKDLASFLGITVSSLSRIRARIAKKPYK